MTSGVTASLLDRLLDPEQLQAITGHEAVAVSAQVEPGREVRVGLAPAPDAAPTGWMRALWPDHPERRGRRRLLPRRRPKEPAKEAVLDGDVLLRWGALVEDPRLGHALRHVGRGGFGRSAPTLTGYEPLHRADLQAGATLTCVTAEPQPLAGLTQASLAGVGLPVLAPSSEVAGTSVTWPTVRGSTLLQAPTPESTRWAGAALARLHLSSWVALGDDHLYRLLSARHHAEGALHTVAVLPGLDAALGERLEAVMERLRARGPLAGADVLLHGRAGPDRLLVADDGRRLLTGFDRAGLGPAAVDLGHWLAVQPDLPGLADDFLGGYELGGGRIPDPFMLFAGRAWGLVSRLLDPVRGADPGWRDAVAAQIDDVAEVVG